MKALERKILSSAEELDDHSLSLLAALGSSEPSSDPCTKNLKALLKAIEGSHVSLEKLSDFVKEQLPSIQLPAAPEDGPIQSRETLIKFSTFHSVIV